MANRLRLATLTVSAALHVGFLVALVVLTMGPLEKVTRKAQVIFQPAKAKPQPEIKPMAVPEPSRPAGRPNAAPRAKPPEAPKQPKIDAAVAQPATQPSTQPAGKTDDDGDSTAKKPGDDKKDDGGGGGKCTNPPCGTGEGGGGGEVVAVDPQTMAAHRISGDARIPLPRDVKQALHTAHVPRFGVVVDLCLTAAGVPATVRVHRATGYPAAEAKILEAVRDWRYAPYTIDGAPVPVCTKVSFLYEITE